MRKEIQMLGFRITKANEGWHRSLKPEEVEKLAKIILGITSIDRLHGKTTQQFYSRTLERLKPLLTD